ncbi:helix-turn-helix domain-containing protein [uncultured Sphingomonas sp.]|uniref:MarR family winged helix-turn-helix transcriptional regulator n=1 Tax=uncultured Sphingomonas sp. TaxID=158754 RepID=UPI00261833DF|nr:helix-turn-helix domain-containing protein [uncultured Sphingomonas sp.]
MPDQKAPQPSFLLMDMLRHYYWLDDALNRNLVGLGWPAVSRSQCLILVHVANGVHKASDIARNMGVSRAAMSQFLKEMKVKGLIEFRPDPNDRRAQIVEFSADSEAIRSDALRILDLVEQDLGKRLGQRLLDSLKRSLASDWGEIPTVERTGAAIRIGKR